MQMYAIQTVQCPSHISGINAELPRGTECNVLLTLLGWYDSLLKDRGWACAMLACCVWSLLAPQPEAEIHKVKILLEWDQLSGSSCLQRGGKTQQKELESCGRIHSAPNLHGSPRLYGLDGALLAIHWWVCMYSTTLAWISIWGRS